MVQISSLSRRGAVAASARISWTLALSAAHTATCACGTASSAGPVRTAAPRATSSWVSAHPKAQPLEFWLGRWNGSFAGTQEYATLDILPGARFRCVWQTGPDQECLAQGTVRATDERLELAVQHTSCPRAGSALWHHPDIWARAPGLVLLTRAGEEQHINASVDNELSGPLWILKRSESHGR